MENNNKLNFFEKLFSKKQKKPEIDHTIASFTFQPNHEIKPGMPVQFNNTSKHAEDFVWDFGDGSISTDSDPVHTFQQAGEYKVKLLALSENETDSSKQSIVVELQECFSVKM